jgi:hypothetical protein
MSSSPVFSNSIHLTRYGEFPRNTAASAQPSLSKIVDVADSIFPVYGRFPNQAKILKIVLCAILSITLSLRICSSLSY